MLVRSGLCCRQGFGIEAKHFNDCEAAVQVKVGSHVVRDWLATHALAFPQFVENVLGIISGAGLDLDPGRLRQVRDVRDAGPLSR